VNDWYLYVIKIGIRLYLSFKVDRKVGLVELVGLRACRIADFLLTLRRGLMPSDI
jgi:hypothetical protein